MNILKKIRYKVYIVLSIIALPIMYIGFYDEVSDAAFDEIPLTAGNVCGVLAGESRKYNLFHFTIWAEPLSYIRSKDGNTAIFQRAYIGPDQQAAFEKVISDYEIHLIQSCVDYMTLNHLVAVTKMENSAFLANVPIASRFENLTNVLFKGIRGVGDDLHKGLTNQQLNHVRFVGVMNNISLRDVDAKSAVFEPAGGTNNYRVSDLIISWSNIRGADFKNTVFTGDSRIEWTDAAEVNYINADTLGLKFSCTNLADLKDPQNPSKGRKIIQKHDQHTPSDIISKSRKVLPLDSCRSK